MYGSGDKKLFNFVEYGTLIDIYLKLARGEITIKEAELNLKDSLKK